MTQSNELRAGALKLPSVIMQAITHIAPAAGVVLSIKLITEHAEIAAPLAFLIAFGIVLTLGISLTQLARQFPSAGGYYTYVSRTVHPRAGFLTAWLYFLYDPICAAVNLAYMGYLLEKTLWVDLRIAMPWWAFLTAAALGIAFLSYRGIRISSESLTVLGLLEIAMLLALGVAALLRPGPGGVNVASYTHVPSMGGLCMGVVLTIMSFSGFESVAPLAEEAENPRRNLPRAILGSLALMGCLYLFSSWTIIVGWGTQDVAGFVKSDDPVFMLAARLLPMGKWIVLLALLNSVLAVSIASTNAATRVFFAMGRAGALPRWLGTVHPRLQTPVRALWLQTLITLAVGLGLGLLLGPFREFEFLATVLSLAVMVVYGMGNVGVFLYYFRQRRSEFRILLHAFCPFLSSLALLVVAYFSIFPLPASPLCYAPLAVVVWLLIGIGLLLVSRSTHREESLLTAGRAAYGTQPETHE